MQHPGWLLVLVGGLLVVAGAIWLLGPWMPWLGRLPGDISVERDGFRFYFPLASCILISLLLSGVSWLLRLLR